MKKDLINWKKKTGIYIGRFQPIHEGHLRADVKFYHVSYVVQIT